ncbi:carboxylating nicotinate-nucleotide diphosphorylase [Myxococcota bacterium]|nr:carboxylating nicotinate-nucleotide diphosphorylase [Myxococcota bacterium]
MPNNITTPPSSTWAALLDRALAEDLGTGDATSQAVLDPFLKISSRLEARESLVVCGLELAEATFRQLDETIRFESHLKDGSSASAGSVVATIEGTAIAILAAERTALNFVQRMSGIATETKRYVSAVSETGVTIVDTRKTIPGWRVLDKYAVRIGGGRNHRSGLYDAILIKDNHIAAAGGVGIAIQAVKNAAAEHLWLQVEVESLEDAEEALGCGIDSLLLDNRSVSELREFVKQFGTSCILEASGGVTLETVNEIAKTGVHRISIGALTHSSKAADLALEATDLRGKTPDAS